MTWASSTSGCASTRTIGAGSANVRWRKPTSSVSVGHYTEEKDPEFYKKSLYIVDKKADIPPGMYACGAIQYHCPECGKRVTVLDPFLPVRDEEKHEGTIVFRNGELDDFLWL